MKRNVSSVPGSVLPSVLVLFAVLCVAAIAAWVFLTPKSKELPPSETPAVNVEVETVQAIPELPDTFELPAVVEPLRVIAVAAEVQGTVEERGTVPETGVPLDKGMDCEAGQVLVKLNTDILQAELDRVQATAEFAQTEYERLLGLQKQGAATLQELQRTASELRIAKAVLEVVRARLNRAQIAAPISGVVNELVEEGVYVKEGEPVAEIVEIDRVKVIVQVPELEIGSIHVGAKATVFASLDSREETYDGQVTYISRLADPATRVTRVEIELDNPRRLLYSGHLVKVRLTRETLKNVIRIPLDAIIPLENGKVVYVVENGKAQSREVKIDIHRIQSVEQSEPGRGANGGSREQRVQVLSGLEPGDQLIVKGQQFVGSDQPVVVQASSDSPAHTQSQARP